MIAVLIGNGLATLVALAGSTTQPIQHHIRQYYVQQTLFKNPCKIACNQVKTTL